MDVLLVSARTVDSRPHPSRDVVAGLATRLAAADHRVRWIRPVTPGEGELSDPPGVRVLRVPTRRVPFRSVQARLGDLPTEQLLSAELRRAPPDVAHVHGFGGGASYLLPWIADRLGVPSVVAVTAIADVLCHRRTLVDDTGRDCDAWDRPERCVDCTRTPFDGGFGAVRSVLAAACAIAGSLSPFPSVVDFQNRIDMVVQGLSSAAIVCVPDAGSVAALIRAGVPARLLRAGVPEPAAERWLDIYRETQATAVGT